MERNLILRLNKLEREDILTALRMWKEKVTTIEIDELIDNVDCTGEDDPCPFMSRQNIPVGENVFHVPWCNHIPSQVAKP